MMQKIEEIGVLSLAKIEAVCMALVGLIAGIFIAVAGTSFGGMGSGLLAIIIVPIVYGVLGFIGGLLGGLLYNLVAKWVGGIEIKLKH